MLLPISTINPMVINNPEKLNTNPNLQRTLPASLSLLSGSNSAFCLLISDIIPQATPIVKIVKYGRACKNNKLMLSEEKLLCIIR